MARSLSGGGTITAGATQKIAASAALTGIGSLTAAGGPPAQGGAVLTRSGLIVAGATVPLGNPPAPVVPFFEAGYRPGKGDFDTWIYDNFWFLTTRVVFRARQSVNTQLVPTSPGAIEFDTIDEDPFAGWDPVNFAWKAPYTGWYQVTITGWIATPSSGGILITSLIGRAAGNWLSHQNVQTSHKQGSVGTFWVYVLGGQDTVSAGLGFNGTSPVTSITAGTQSSMEIAWASD